MTTKGRRILVVLGVVFGWIGGVASRDAWAQMSFAAVSFTVNLACAVVFVGVGALMIALATMDAPEPTQER